MKILTETKGIRFADEFVFARASKDARSDKGTVVWDIAEIVPDTFVSLEDPHEKPSEPDILSYSPMEDGTLFIEAYGIA